MRIFMVNTGPNLLSSLHPIGNIWTRSRAWMLGALAMPPMRFLQSVPVPPGNAIVADMELPVPQTIQIVDHSMSRAARQGAVAEIVVTGEENLEIFNPRPFEISSGGIVLQRITSSNPLDIRDGGAALCIIKTQFGHRSQVAINPRVAA